jgi:DNA-directed RNA polymerase specialized sigma24 family protein
VSPFTLDGSCRRLPVRQLPAARRRVVDDATARLLLAGTPRQVLAHIVPGDPLGLRGLCAGRLREQARFADVDRVLVRSQARIAREAPRRRSRPGIAEWLRARIDEALLDVLDGESGEAPEPDSVLALLSEPLGLSPLEMARGCACFNAMAARTRMAFFAVVIDGLTLERATEQLGRPALEVARLARRGLDAFRIGSLPAGAATTGSAPEAQHQRRKHGSDDRPEIRSASGIRSNIRAEVHQVLHPEEDCS